MSTTSAHPFRLGRYRSGTGRRLLVDLQAPRSRGIVRGEGAGFFVTEMWVRYTWPGGTKAEFVSAGAWAKDSDWRRARGEPATRSALHHVAGQLPRAGRCEATKSLWSWTSLDTVSDSLNTRFPSEARARPWAACPPEYPEAWAGGEDDEQAEHWPPRCRAKEPSRAESSNSPCVEDASACLPQGFRVFGPQA